ncbi:TetR/AcrR family transcriptional regulator [Micromonospora sp. NPDC004336]
MERMGRQERQRQNRNRLLDAAQRLLAERGPAASLDDIAAAAGLTKGAVYSSFRNKEDIILALLDRQLDIIGTDLTAVTTGETDMVQAFAALSSANSTGDRAGENADFALLMMEFWIAAMRNPRVRPRYIEALRRTRAGIAAHLAARADGPDPALVARTATLLLGLDIGLSIQRLVDPESVPETWYAEAFELLVGPLSDDARRADGAGD